MLKIDYDVPIPSDGRHTGSRRSLYPFDDMEVGDSFFRKGPYDRMQANILGCASRRKPKKFTTRRVTGGIRCWRIK